MKKYFSTPKIDSQAKEYTLSKTSIELFNKGRPGQGYIGIVNLTTGKIYLIPAFNHKDGKIRQDKDGKAFTVSVESLLELGRNTGDLHLRTAGVLKLGTQGGVNGKLLGFGLFKDNAGRIRDFRNRSASQNFFAIEYTNHFKNYYCEQTKSDSSYLLRSIPSSQFEKIYTTVLKGLGIITIIPMMEANCIDGRMRQTFALQQHYHDPSKSVSIQNSILSEFRTILLSESDDTIKEYIDSNTPELLLTVCINSTDTAMHLSCQYSNVNIVKYLIECYEQNELSIDELNRDGDNLLHAALKSDSLEILEFVLTLFRTRIRNRFLNTFMAGPIVDKLISLSQFDGYTINQVSNDLAKKDPVSLVKLLYTSWKSLLSNIVLASNIDTFSFAENNRQSNAVHNGDDTNTLAYFSRMHWITLGLRLCSKMEGKPLSTKKQLAYRALLDDLFNIENLQLAIVELTTSRYFDGMLIPLLNKYRNYAGDKCSALSHAYENNKDAHLKILRITLKERLFYRLCEIVISRKSSNSDLNACILAEELFTKDKSKLLSHVSDDGYSLIQLACRENNIIALVILLNYAGYDHHEIISTTGDEHSPMEMACKYKNEAMIRILLEFHPPHIIANEFVKLVKLTEDSGNDKYCIRAKSMAHAMTAVQFNELLQSVSKYHAEPYLTVLKTISEARCTKLCASINKNLTYFFKPDVDNQPPTNNNSQIYNYS